MVWAVNEYALSGGNQTISSDQSALLVLTNSAQRSFLAGVWAVNVRGQGDDSEFDSHLVVAAGETTRVFNLGEGIVDMTESLGSVLPGETADDRRQSCMRTSASLLIELLPHLSYVWTDQQVCGPFITCP